MTNAHKHSALQLLPIVLCAFAVNDAKGDPSKRLSPGPVRLSVSGLPRKPITASANAAQPSGYTYIRISDPKRMIHEIELAIAASPKNADHYFNLAVTLGLVLQPSDIPASQIAYKRALALGATPDSQLDKLLK